MIFKDMVKTTAPNVPKLLDGKVQFCSTCKIDDIEVRMIGLDVSPKK